MKRSIQIGVLAIILFLSGQTQAQSESDLDALLNVIGNEAYDSLASGDAAQLADVAFYNRHGYHLGKTAGKDFSAYPDASTITPLYPHIPAVSYSAVSDGTLDLKGYDITLKENEYQYFRLSGTDDILVILPGRLLSQKRKNIQ